MAEFAPTPAQQAAIEARGSAVLVSAGAGSGKTRVLTERLMARICDREHPVDLDRFLIITFTRAAAGELRGRIMEELAAALALDPSNRRLRRQSALVRRAQIGTIHSFCAAFLRENSHLAGIGPDFGILDEQRGRSMKAGALERVLDACYEQPEKHPGFLLLADTVGAGRDDRRLGELVLELHQKMQCHARPEALGRRQIRRWRPRRRTWGRPSGAGSCCRTPPRPWTTGRRNSTGCWPSSSPRPPSPRPGWRAMPTRRRPAGAERGLGWAGRRPGPASPSPSQDGQAAQVPGSALSEG